MCLIPYNWKPNFLYGARTYNLIICTKLFVHNILNLKKTLTFVSTLALNFSKWNRIAKCTLLIAYSGSARMGYLVSTPMSTFLKYLRLEKKTPIVNLSERKCNIINLQLSLKWYCKKLITINEAKYKDKVLRKTLLPCPWKSILRGQVIDKTMTSYNRNIPFILKTFLMKFQIYMSDDGHENTDIPNRKLRSEPHGRLLERINHIVCWFIIIIYKSLAKCIFNKALR